MAKDITFKKLGTYWPLYFFILPSFLLVATFSYFPAGSAMYHSFFRWDGNTIKIFVGLANFNKALGQPFYWLALMILSLVTIANSQKHTRLSRGLKLFSGLGLPLGNLVVIHRIHGLPDLSPAEALPPALVALAVFALVKWRLPSDHDNRGIVFLVLGLVAGASVFSAAGMTPNAAWSLVVWITGLVLWGLLSPGKGLEYVEGMRIVQTLLGLGMVFWSLAQNAGGDAALWSGFSIIAILVLANLVKIIPSIATAVVIHRLKSETANYWYRVLFVVPMIIPGMVTLLIWKFFFRSEGLFNLVLRESGVMHLLHLWDYWSRNGVFLDPVQIEEGMRLEEIFRIASEATPTWLGSPELVLPAFILWGFPWVGVVGVLIYLAGLQSIDQSVYEAADLDGVGPFGKFLNIELPLILTQVRINLVLMIIGTLQMYGMILILYGDSGGPNGRMMVPGLLMFRSAFVESYAGYACSIGLILFFLILVLTEINNRFVRVEK